MQLTDLVMQVCDALEGPLSAGGVIVDFHSSEFFPERHVSPSINALLVDGL